MEPPCPPATAADFTIPVPFEDRPPRVSSSSWSSSGSTDSPDVRSATTLGGFARRTLGIILLLVTVVLWTASSFLASVRAETLGSTWDVSANYRGAVKTIFADDTYSKPYFVTYINTSFFAISLIPIVVKALYDRRRADLSLQAILSWKSTFSSYLRVSGEGADLIPKPDNQDESLRRASRSSSCYLPLVESPSTSRILDISGETPRDTALNLWETAKLSMEFCILWFVANYFSAACLQYTTVASSTILTATSSIWTLLLGALPIAGVEMFTLRKLVGVLASMTGIILISTVDLSGDNDKSRGSFPHKSQKQIALGDALALASAALYGLYTILMKKRIGDEGRVNMPLFFGLVGLFNVLTLWPGFVILHFTGEELFEIPPTRRILAIVLMNSATSFVSDFCWAYAMLLTSPLVVTVGLSLTIPLSLIGQMVLDAQYSSFTYWIGAGIVFLSFLFINHESKEDAQSKV